MSTNKTNYSAIPSDPEDDRQIPNAIPPARVKFRRILWAIAGFIVVIGAVSTIVVFTTRRDIPPPRKPSVIMMISDGFGPASETFARQYIGWRDNRPPRDLLPLDYIHKGHSRTQSSSSLVTDSAAGATAFACGLKSYNGAIGVDPQKMPCGTVLESAKLHHGMFTGLVATSRITHATPGAFSAHVDWRDKENKIAEQQIGYNPLGRTVDLMFGGGACQFLSNKTEGGCRADDRDLFAEAQEKFGWHVKNSREEFDAIQADDPLPLMSLFAPSHMSYEIDRDPVHQPSLSEMTRKALDILEKHSRDNDKGFFLMIEGSRIDMAAHTNDPAAHIYDILEYHNAAQVVLDFVAEHPNTIVIATSDHETGGFTLGRQVTEDYPEYKWNPEVISRVRNSSEVLARAWNEARKVNTASADFLRKVIITEGLGITDATKEEIDRILDWSPEKKDITDLENILAEMVSRRALIGWTTHGHTAVDVNLYAYGARAELLQGSHENTDIGDFISYFLGLNLDDITRRLNENKELRTEAEEELPRVSVHQRNYD